MIEKSISVALRNIECFVSIVSVRSRRLTMIAFFCVLLIGCFVFAERTSAQSVSPPAYTNNNSDKTLRGSARVNPSTLAMEFSLNLGGYPGRAGNSVPLTLNYSSKVW